MLRVLRGQIVLAWPFLNSALNMTLVLAIINAYGLPYLLVSTMKYISMYDNDTINLSVILGVSNSLF